MIYYLFIFFIFFLSVFIEEIKQRKLIIAFIIICLTLFAGTRLDVDEDYPMYYHFFYYIEDTFKKFQNREVPIELCIYIVPHFYKFFFNSNLYVAQASLLTFAFLGVVLKVISINRYSCFFALSILLYTSNLFLMQEMTTIRAGVASGFFLLSIKDLELKKIKSFSFKMFFSFIFHNSSILFILSFILVYFRVKIKYYYVALMFSLIFGILKLNAIKILFLDRLFPRVELYLKVMEWKKDESTNLFSFRIIIALFFVVVFAIYYDRLKDNKYFENLFRIHIFSLCLFFLLSSSAEVFSIRGFELLSVIQILLYPMIVNVFPPKSKIVGWALIFIISAFQIYYLVDIANIYKSYQSWFF